MSKETLQEEIDELKKIKQSLQMDIIELDDKILFQDFGQKLFWLALSPQEC